MSTQLDSAVIERVKVKEPAKYNIIAYDNPLTSFEEVIYIFMKCFNHSKEEALLLAMQINNKGSAVCGTYSKEMADMKLNLIQLTKQVLINKYPDRAVAINELKFTIEEE